MTPDEQGAAPVLLFDGCCGLCNWIVRFVLRHDRRGLLRFARLDGAFARGLMERQPGLERQDTVVWYRPAGRGSAEQVELGSDAAIEVLWYLRGIWRLGLLLRLVPRPVRDAFYTAIARNRSRLFGRRRSCPAPPADQRHRFIP